MTRFSRYLLSIFAITMAVQLIGCGAADISSAKLYRQRRDYVKANDLLEKALKEEPTSDEAWFLYTQNLLDLKNYERIAVIIDTAMLYSVTHRAELSSLKHNTWIELYNGGLNAYNANPDNKEAQQAAIGLLESAEKLSPEQAETYELLGTVYNSAGDTARAMQSYGEEINRLGASHDQGVAMGLMLHETPDAVVRSIGGSPARQMVTSIGASDSALIYMYPSKSAAIYFERNPKMKNRWELSGWRVGASEAEQLQPIRISTQAYEMVANNYYQKGLAEFTSGNKSAASTDFNKAIPLLMTLQQVDPTDEFASQAIPDIYTRLGQTDKAKQQYESLLAQHPLKTTYISYGSLLMKANDFPGAVKAYQQALDLDPSYQTALYNLAAIYKTQAATNQKSKVSTYKEELQKSTDYFERLNAIDKGDPVVLENLAENYDVLGQKDKYIQLLGEFEALKNSDAAKSSSYWEMLGKLYSRSTKSSEAQAAFKKADELRQQGH